MAIHVNFGDYIHVKVTNRDVKQTVDLLVKTFKSDKYDWCTELLKYTGKLVSGQYYDIDIDKTIILYNNYNNNVVLRQVINCLMSDVLHSGKDIFDLQNKLNPLSKVTQGKIIRFKYNGGSAPGMTRIVRVESIEDGLIKGKDVEKDDGYAYRSFKVDNISGQIEVLN